MWIGTSLDKFKNKVTDWQQAGAQALSEFDRELEESLSSPTTRINAGGGEDESPEDLAVLKHMLAQFQLDQVEVTRVYQLEIERLVKLYEEKTGEKVPQHASAVAQVRVGGDVSREDAMKTFEGIGADQLRAQVEVLLDSVSSWEERVRQLLQEKLEVALEVEKNQAQVRRYQHRMGDLVDRVKLQQVELERYMSIANELQAKHADSLQTVENMVTEYSQLCSMAQATEERLGERIRELENNNDEVVTKLAAYERNILQLLNTQAELERQQKQQLSLSRGDGGGTNGDDGAAATVEALKKQLADKEEEIKRMTASFHISDDQHAGQPSGADGSDAADRDAAAELELARIEIDRLKKESDKAKKGLEQSQKVCDKLGKELALLRTQKTTDEETESALKLEVTELQAKLEAAYKTHRQQQDGAQDKYARLERELSAAREEHAALRRAGEEGQAASGRALSDTVKRLEAEKEALQAEVERTRAEAETVHREAIESLKQEHDTALRRAREEGEKARDKAAAEAGARLDAEKEALRAALAAVGSQDVAAVEARLREQMEGLKQDHEAALRKAAEDGQEAREKAVAELKERIQAEKEALKAAYDASRSEGVADVEKQLAEQLKALKREHEVAMQQSHDEGKQALEKAVAEAVGRSEVEKEALKAELERMSSDAVAAVEKRLQETVEALKAEQVTLVKDWEARQVQWTLDKANQEKQHEATLLEAAQKADAALGALRMELEGQAARMAAEASDRARQQSAAAGEEAVRRAKEEAENDKTAALAEAQRQFERDSAATIEAIRVEMTAEVQAAKKAYQEAQTALDNVQKKWQSELTVALDKQAQELEAEQLRALEAMRSEMQARVDAANQERAEAIELYRQENRKRKLIHNKLLELQGNIRVLCRVRPVLPVELNTGEATDVTEISTPEDIIVHKDPVSKSRFEFDRVFGPAASQEEVFESIKPVITSFVDGYNVAIMAYGQTGSGKTFTMEGSPDNRGVNFRALEEVFELIADRAGEWEYKLQISMVEIYRDDLFDLLVARTAKDPPPKLEIRGGDNDYHVPGMSLYDVESMHDVIELMNQGKQNRAVGAHDMNEHSSRSHMIVSLRLQGRNVHDRSTVQSKLQLVDLAGSERVKKTDATGDRFQEGIAINMSLSCLGEVINALANKRGHVPYRTNILTRFLRDSLGGNSKVFMVVNVSPTQYNAGESVCSLTFASRCRTVELGPAKKNEGSGDAKASSSSSTSSSTGSPGSGGPSSSSSTSGSKGGGPMGRSSAGRGPLVSKRGLPK